MPKPRVKLEGVQRAELLRVDPEDETGPRLSDDTLSDTFRPYPIRGAPAFRAGRFARWRLMASGTLLAPRQLFRRGTRRSAIGVTLADATPSGAAFS
jgi:hypothetical protein